MTRSEWLELRSEYLSIQKANVAQLKSSLKALKQTDTNQTAGFIQLRCSSKDIILLYYNTTQHIVLFVYHWLVSVSTDKSNSTMWNILPSEYFPAAASDFFWTEFNIIWHLFLQLCCRLQM